MQKAIMVKIRIAITIIIVAGLFVSEFAGLMFYYNGILQTKNAQISALNNEVAEQNKQLSNLTSQISEISNYTDANLVTSLGISEVGNTSMSMYNYPYYRLYISGSVKNTGHGMALNAGLHVVAYATNGLVEINMTVPLDNEVDFGTDSSTNAFVQSWDGRNYSLQLGSLSSGQTAAVDLNIYHEGRVTNWTVTSVWWTP
jgi:hypothetical protein